MALPTRRFKPRREEAGTLLGIFTGVYGEMGILRIDWNGLLISTICYIRQVVVNAETQLGRQGGERHAASTMF
ncbi:hypothetical protein KC351_g74 [Hortaea werneckii]|nr:hypothetical protein KC351_g74 [Hortaea werneckii]